MRELSAVKTIKTINMVAHPENQTRKAVKQTLILGLGNELLGDKGVGVHAARQLKQAKLAKTTKIVEVGTAILDALLELKNAERIILLDAIKDGGTPGTVYKIPLDRHSTSPHTSSIQSFELFRTMAIAGRKEPLPIIVFGVEPKDIGRSMTLSVTVTKSLPYLIEAVQEELRT
jgi:hydrogenase maturation protease